MRNINHDLIQQLSEDLDSLWRYQDYLKNAEACPHCAELWKKCVAMDEEKVNMLKAEVVRHVEGKMFD